MDLDKQHYVELISTALNERPGWVPLGPLEAARRGRKLLTYHRANVLADLERGGLIALTPGKSGRIATIRLTEAGRQTIRVMPDDLNADWFPLARDIAKAKERVK